MDSVFKRILGIFRRQTDKVEVDLDEGSSVDPPYFTVDPPYFIQGSDTEDNAAGRDGKIEQMKLDQNKKRKQESETMGEEEPPMKRKNTQEGEEVPNCSTLYNRSHRTYSRASQSTPRLQSVDDQVELGRIGSLPDTNLSLDISCVTIEEVTLPVNMSDDMFDMDVFEEAGSVTSITEPIGTQPCKQNKRRRGSVKVEELPQPPLPPTDRAIDSGYNLRSKRYLQRPIWWKDYIVTVPVKKTRRK